MSPWTVLLCVCLCLCQKLTTAQVDECVGTVCVPHPSNGWMSNITTVVQSVTSATLNWLPDLMLTNGRVYQVALRNFTAEENFTVIDGPMHPITGINLVNLQPATIYQAVVCLPRVNISGDLPPPPMEPTIPGCGVCRVCFETLPVNYEFLVTEAMLVNQTHTNYTCEVEVNVDFSLVWSSNGRTLVDGDLIDGVPVSIQSVNELLDGGTDYVIRSLLIGPDALTDMFVTCEAVTAFGSDFRDVLLTEDLQTTVAFPLWVVTFMVLIPLVVIGILIFVIAFSIAKRKRMVKEVREELSQLKQLNDYQEYRHQSRDQSPAKPAEPAESDVLDLNELLPEELVVDPSLVDVSTVIGQGEFGVVYRGHLRRGSVSDVVAVKSLKGIFVTENDVQNALKEISKMKNFDHPNVMTLVGVCKATEMSGGAPSIIMPYMARGSLLNYLRKERDGLMPSADVDVTQVGAIQKLLMQICLQISKGMAYLASLRFVHRDLAARNCMIDDKGIIKVADFGLAEDIYMRNYFRQSSQDTAVKLPLKWMAPESIKLGIFSEKSDVWSYGVTCWEVFTAGEIPYPGIHPKEVVELLEDGGHLKRPKNQALSDNMFGYMCSCWAFRPEDRPQFEELESSLNKELTTLADYVDLSMINEDSNVNTTSEE